MKLEKINFSYNTGVVSEKQFNEHMKLYAGYISKTNEITEKLSAGTLLRKDSNKTYSEYRGLKKGETYALDGVILHEEYFKNISRGTSSPGACFMAMTDKYFGGFEKWAEDFIACAKAARGWCATVYEQRSRSLRNILLDAHDEGNICMAFPLLVIDMYEHAYFIDFGTDSAAYIKKFMEHINWQVVEGRALELKAQIE